MTAGIGLYPDGLYSIDQLGTWPLLPERYRKRPRPRLRLTDDNGPELLDTADVLACGADCSLEGAAKRAGMKRVPHHPGDFQLFLKGEAAPE